MLLDFTSPLRIVGTHEPVVPVSISSYGIRVQTVEGARVWIVRSNGKPQIGYGEYLTIENTPREPRIVTRWAEVFIGPYGSYHTLGGETFQSRFTPSPGRLIAKLLIEEIDP